MGPLDISCHVRAWFNMVACRLVAKLILAELDYRTL